MNAGVTLNTRPVFRKFTVNVANKAHRLTQGLPDSFDVSDELYLIELQENCDVLLTTELVKDPSPEGFGFTYDKDTSLLPDGKTRALGYSKTVGQGEVVYVALGHCHSPQTNAQPVVDESVTDGGAPPRIFHGVWDEPTFAQLIKNGVPIIDIRTEKEWKSTGIIDQSKTMTFFDEEGNFDTEIWLEELRKIAKKNDLPTK